MWQIYIIVKDLLKLTMKKASLTFWFCFMMLITLASCAKEESRENSIPYAAVEIDINYKNEYQFDNPYYYKQYYPGKDNIKSAGYVGVFAISLINPLNGSIYVAAFDLCCPYEAPARNELQLVKSSWTLKCPKCGSHYSLIDAGRAVSGVASDDSKKLKMYGVYKDEVFYRIRN